MLGEKESCLSGTREITCLPIDCVGLSAGGDMKTDGFKMSVLSAPLPPSGAHCLGSSIESACENVGEDAEKREP